MNLPVVFFQLCTKIHIANFFYPVLSRPEQGGAEGGCGAGEPDSYDRSFRSQNFTKGAWKFLFVLATRIPPEHSRPVSFDRQRMQKQVAALAAEGIFIGTST